MASAASETIRVAVRVRPLLPREVLHEEVVSTLEEPVGGVRVLRGGTDGETGDEDALETTFDASYGQEATQGEVYDFVSAAVDDVVNGINSTVFAYGQTGTGKTHTMLGADFADDGVGASYNPEAIGGDDEYATAAAGIIPRAMNAIFEKLRAQRASSGDDTSTSVKCTYVEIYQEKIHDLVAPFKLARGADPLDIRREKLGLELRERADGEVYVHGIEERTVKCAADVMEILRRGGEHRAVRQTHMNEHSSRSHTILTLAVDQRIAGDAQGDGGMRSTSRLNLVDLAGSERWTQAHGSASVEEVQISEMTSINVSLTALCSVMVALSTTSRAHIPFRDSKLTHMLQPSLGGNCRTLLVATVSPSADAGDETLSTLRFASRARSVQTFALQNKTVDVSLRMQMYRDEVARLKTMLHSYARTGGPPADGDDEANGPLSEMTRRCGALEAENRKLRLELSQARDALRAERGRRQRASEAIGAVTRPLASETRGDMLANLAAPAFWDVAGTDGPNAPVFSTGPKFWPASPLNKQAPSGFQSAKVAYKPTGSSAKAKSTSRPPRRADGAGSTSAEILQATSASAIPRSTPRRELLPAVSPTKQPPEVQSSPRLPVPETASQPAAAQLPPLPSSGPGWGRSALLAGSGPAVSAQATRSDSAPNSARVEDGAAPPGGWGRSSLLTSTTPLSPPPPVQRAWGRSSLLSGGGGDDGGGDGDIDDPDLDAVPELGRPSWAPETHAPLDTGSWIYILGRQRSSAVARAVAESERKFSVLDSARQGLEERAMLSEGG